MIRVLVLGVFLVLAVIGAVRIAAEGHGGHNTPADVARSVPSTPTLASTQPRPTRVPDPTQARVSPTVTATVIPLMPTNPIPQDAAAAAVLFGGAADEWQPFEGNGWIFRSTTAIPLSVPAQWRIDYTAPDGAIFSCGAEQRPGVYGITTVVTAAATLWYVPGETACPAWTIWSQAHGA